MESPLILLIDNRDSYTFNLFHLLAAASGSEPLVVAGPDAIEQRVPQRIAEGEFTHVVLSPGPGRPEEHPHLEAIISAAEHTPLLGVCLGLQALVLHHGGSLMRVEPVHGKTSEVSHDGSGIFRGLPSTLRAVRYHSLAAQLPLPPSLEERAVAADGVVMAVQSSRSARASSLGSDAHDWHWGVQFHPEAHETDAGAELIANFLRLERPAPTVPSLQPRHLRVPAPTDMRAALSNLAAHYPLVAACQSGKRFTSIGVGTDTCPRIESAGGDDSFLAALRTDLAAGAPLTQHFVDLPPEAPFVSGWMGYLGYEAPIPGRIQPTSAAPDFQTGGRAGPQAPSQAPDAVWFRPDFTIIVDHDSGIAHLLGAHKNPQQLVRHLRCRASQQPPESNPESTREPTTEPITEPITGRWRQTDDQYVAGVEAALEYLRRGDSYEICLTDQFEGASPGKPLDYLSLDEPYSGYFKADDSVELICRSPELFLQIDAQRRITSCPIKGTSPRGTNESEDKRLAVLLAADEKTRAENMMILDLTRNDLGRVSEVGSVRVESLLGVHSHTVHSLYSTVSGQLRADCDAVDAICACFPPGSMTGAPKQRTMEIIAELEGAPRGIYSGSFGFLDYRGTAQLNVVIRSLVRVGDVWSVGAGGAIVADSVPEAELEERNLKARTFPLRESSTENISALAAAVPEVPAPEVSVPKEQGCR